MHDYRMGAQVYGLGANESTCTPLATPLSLMIEFGSVMVIKYGRFAKLLKDGEFTV